MKKRREQLDLRLGGDKPTAPERGLEVHCANCGARFVAYYGQDEEVICSVHVRACGLCHGEAYRRDNFKGATIRLVAEVTARR